MNTNQKHFKECYDLGNACLKYQMTTEELEEWFTSKTLHFSESKNKETKSQLKRRSQTTISNAEIDDMLRLRYHMGKLCKQYGFNIVDLHNIAHEKLMHEQRKERKKENT